MQQNPYEPPTQSPHAGGMSTDVGGELTHDGWVRCPRCNGMEVAMPTFTWWGGMLGQKLLNHVKCHGCGNTYNGKTGQSNTAKIVIYQGVAIVLMLLVMWQLYL